MYKVTWMVQLCITKEDFDYALETKKIIPSYSYRSIANRIAQEHEVSDVPESVLLDIAKELEKYCENHLTKNN